MLSMSNLNPQEIIQGPQVLQFKNLTLSSDKKSNLRRIIAYNIINIQQQVDNSA